MPSTAIRRFEYRSDTSELLVTFVTGRRYIYADVPDEVYRRFRAVTSKGGFFNRHIRDHFPYRELDPIF